jgi:hypothetical protein
MSMFMLYSNWLAVRKQQIIRANRNHFLKFDFEAYTLPGNHVFLLVDINLYT